MRTIAIAALALLLFACGCGSERSSAEGDQPFGSGGTSGGAGGGSAGTAEHAAAAGSGGSVTGGEYIGSGGGGGIGAVRGGPSLSTGGAGAPYDIWCEFYSSYGLNQAVPSIDGCNVCTCGMQGIECSDRACRGQLSADGDTTDGDPFVACTYAGDCGEDACVCTELDGSDECVTHCSSYSCDYGICVNRGTRPCSLEDTSLCLENEFCDFSFDAACGTKGIGDCALIHTEARCTQDENPACGCDGVRYRNGCFARSAGQSISPIDNCE